jgi:hypothetical protein
MGRFAVNAFLCVPLMAQDVRLQWALWGNHDPAIQKALEHAEARTGFWVVSMSQSQQLLFAPAIVREVSLNIDFRVRNNQDCSSTNGPPGKPPVTSCGPSSPETVIDGVDFDLTGDLFINPDGSPIRMGPESQGVFNSQSIRVRDMALSGDQLHFSGTWEKADCCALFPTKVPIAVDAKFSPDGTQLTGTMICDGKSESLTFERTKESGAQFGGDWIEQGGLLFHIHSSVWGGGHIAASFDQISAGIFGTHVEAAQLGAQLSLWLMPPAVSMFTAHVSADGSSMTGQWSFDSPGGNDFRRLESSTTPPK